MEIDQVEKKLEPSGFDLARSTYLLLGLSVVSVHGQQPLTKDQILTISQVVTNRYTRNPSFLQADNRQRSQLYFIYAAATGELNRCLESKSANDIQSGQTLARSMLQQFGLSS
jgi:hypothetical protein